MKTFIPLVLCLCMLSLGTAQTKKATNKKSSVSKKHMDSIKTVQPLMHYIMQYTETDKPPKQSDFNELMQIMGAKESTNGMTKKQGFAITDFYIKASQGKKTKNDSIKMPDVLEGKGENLPNVDAIDLKKAIKESMSGMSYPDFKAEVLRVAPETSETKIREAYNQLLDIKSNKN